MFEHPWPRRIHIVGTSGAGKTTLARSLARALGYPHIELDALNWEPGWTEAPLPVFQDRVRQAAAAPSWVVDGNYGKARSQLWEGTPSVVWLDYPFRNG